MARSNYFYLAECHYMHINIIRDMPQILWSPQKRSIEKKRFQFQIILFLLCKRQTKPKINAKTIRSSNTSFSFERVRGSLSNIYTKLKFFRVLNDQLRWLEACMHNYSKSFNHLTYSIRDNSNLKDNLSV